MDQTGNRIFARRKQLWLIQEELAEAADSAPQTISAAGLGKKALYPENTFRFCAALDISLDYLLLGKISEKDLSILAQKISPLSLEQYRHLKDVVDSFIAVAIPKENKA